MAEPDNFEEDLFADLYTEDDAPTKPAAAPAEVKSDPAPETEIKEQEPAAQDEPNNQSDEHMYNGEQEMDDDVDFNLGGGNNYEQPSHESHGPGIKEDG